MQNTNRKSISWHRCWCPWGPFQHFKVKYL